MGFHETAVLYGLIGLAVSASLGLQRGAAPLVRRIGLHALWTLLWPFFAPVLFGGAVHDPDRGAAARGAGQRAARDPRLQAAQQRLLQALGGLDGVAREVLEREAGRVQKLAGSLGAMEQRLHEMDALLASPEFDPARAEAALQEMCARGPAQDDPRLESLRARRRNIEQLRALRERAAQDLERALLKMEEMASQILLLRYTNRPETELVELVREIAAAVEGLSEGLTASA
jgi:hypothetical protein